MLSKFRFWILAFPDITKPIGGVKQLHRLCEILSSLKYECYLVQEHNEFHPGWFQSNVNTVSRISWLSRTDLTKNRDIIIIPETFLPAVTAIFPSLKKILFNQNFSYTFGLPGNPFDVSKSIASYSRSQILQVWSISKYDTNFISSCLGVPDSRLFRIVNALSSSDSFSHSVPKKRQIAYMPRKNSRDSDIIVNLIRLQPKLRSWKLVPIQNCSHSQVISTFQKSLIYLSFGHPEGFGLPVAEAMACGCAVIGYSGLGGRELFSLESSLKISYQVEFGDWAGFIRSLLAFQFLIESSPDYVFSHLASHAMNIKRLYNINRMKDSVALAVNNISLDC